MGRVRITRLFVLLALVALMAPRVEASRTSVWGSNPPAAPTELTTTSAAGLLAPLAPAAAADAEPTEMPRFDLGDVILVDAERDGEERFGLGPLELLGPAPLRGPPSSYPETRVGGFELLPPFRVGASPSLSLWSRQACGSFSCELASDSRYDPWGLQEWTPGTEEEGIAAYQAQRQTQIDRMFGFTQAAGRAGSVALDVTTDFIPGVGVVKIPTFVITTFREHGREGLVRAGVPLAIIAAVAILTHRAPSLGGKVTREVDEAGLAAEKRAAEHFNEAYNARSWRTLLEARYPGRVSSTTIPEATAKNVRRSGQKHPVTGIPFDLRGFPIYDDVAVFDTGILRSVVAKGNAQSDMRAATRSLREAINRKQVPATKFSTEQLEAIQAGEAKIPGYTWHHHQDVGRLQLVDEELQAKTGHIGGESMWPR